MSLQRTDHTYRRRGGGGDLRLGLHTYLFWPFSGMPLIVFVIFTDFNFLATAGRLSINSWPTASVPAMPSATKTKSDLIILNASKLSNQSSPKIALTKLLSHGMRCNFCNYTYVMGRGGICSLYSPLAAGYMVVLAASFVFRSCSCSPYI